MSIKIYKNNEKKRYFISVNDFLYTTYISGGFIVPFGKHHEYLFHPEYNLQEIKNHEIVFDKVTSNTIIESIIKTIKFDEGFVGKPYFNLKTRRLINIRKKDEEKNLKTLYRGLIQYADLSLYEEDFLKLKEEIEKEFNLV